MFGNNKPHRVSEQNSMPTDPKDDANSSGMVAKRHGLRCREQSSCRSRSNPKDFIPSDAETRIFNGGSWIWVSMR